MFNLNLPRISGAFFEREIQMKYEIGFYKNEDFDDVFNLILASYEWEAPFVGISRIIFCEAMTSEFNKYNNAWEHTVGVVRENGKIIACVWNEGEYDGVSFFLMDKKERYKDNEFLEMMLKFAKTYASGIKEDGRTRITNLFIPSWNKELMEFATSHGLKEGDWKDERWVLPFKGEKFEVKLPEGYTIVDGTKTPDFYLSNIHMHGFNYGKGTLAVDTGVEGIKRLRKSKYYNPKYDLCVLDENKMPVAFCIIWYHGGATYCEMEPLACAWWARRKGISTALIHEAANRVMKDHPDCAGMSGGDQPFYNAIGFEKWGEATAYYWEKEIYPSWEKKSFNQDLSL